jgi:hypothetical protein
MSQVVEIHETGDELYTMGANGMLRKWMVQGDGSLAELDISEP